MCSECKILKRDLQADQEVNVILPSKIEFVEKETAVIFAEEEVLTKFSAKKENQILELLVELDYIKKRVRQLTVRFARLNEVLSYGITKNIKECLDYIGRGK